jgi:predicted ATPase/class 3 adenylate cyclase
VSLAPPTGAVTLVFTDIEGSTKLLHALGDRYPTLVAKHREIMRAAWTKWNGYEHGTEGDSFFVIFGRAQDAVEAVVWAQRELASCEWPDGAAVRVRVGMHTGEPVLISGDYFGIDVHRAARIASAGHGGQVLLSASTRALTESCLPSGVSLLDLGEHRLKDLERPEPIAQLVIEGLPNTFAALKSLETPTNLPASVSSFVGRDVEAREVASMLQGDDVRLVSITGPGGTGKTRLALHVAHAVGEAFKNGVFLVQLAALTHPDMVAESIEQAIELENPQGIDPVANVSTALRDSAVLLVLDNFEHLTDAAPVVATMLSSTKRLKAIITTRSPLRVAAEREYPLAPLSLPDADADVAALESSGAVALFVERAHAMNPAFTLNASNGPAVAQICTRLDGLPLAIELAAARTKLLTPQQILDRLDKRLSLLTGGSRDLPVRHQTIRDTIAWSHDLLWPDAALLFRRLAVFSGGASLDGIESVAGQGVDALTSLQNLLDQSLVRRDSSDEGRFFMLETIRDFAQERLEESGEGPSLRPIHARHMADLATEADGHLRGAQQQVWLKRLDADTDNMRAALRWALDDDAGDPTIGARIAASLGWYWYMRGRAMEGCRWLESALLHADTLDLPLRARLAHRLGILMDQRGEPAAAVKLFEEALQISRDGDDPTEVARALNSLGSSRRGLGELEQARLLFEESLALRRATDDRSGTAVTLFNLGELALDVGDDARALELFTEACEIDRVCGDSWAVAVGTAAIGAARLALGEHDTAEPYLRESLASLHELEDTDRVAETLGLMAGLAGARGDFARSARLAGCADACWERLGFPLSPPDRAHFERQQAPARAAMAAQDFAQAWEEGRMMTVGQGVAYALGPSSVGPAIMDA